MNGGIQVRPDLVGAARYARLLREVGGAQNLAHEVFLWNIRASGAALEALQVFELLLRNAIDAQMRSWNDSLTGSPDWLLQPHPYLLKVLNMRDLEKARRRAAKIARDKARPACHDDVLAQLSFGTWRYLLPSNSNPTKRRLWTEATSKAFPNWPGAWNPESVVSRVASAHELRNRVAHLEPLHRHDLRKARRDMRSVAYAVGIDAARLFTQTERLLPVIDANPFSARG